jgi:hypothetical protein
MENFLIYLLKCSPLFFLLKYYSLLNEIFHKIFFFPHRVYNKRLDLIIGHWGNEGIIASKDKHNVELEISGNFSGVIREGGHFWGHISPCGHSLTRFFCLVLAKNINMSVFNIRMGEIYEYGRIKIKIRSKNTRFTTEGIDMHVCQNMRQFFKQKKFSLVKY